MNHPTTPRWYYSDNGGQAATEDYNFNSSITDVFGDYTTDHLFKLVCRGGGGTLEMEEPAVSCLRLSPRFKPPLEAPVPEMLPSPPSEDEMAKWLIAIVKGDEHEHARGGGERGWTDNNGPRAPSEKSSETPVAPNKATSMDNNEKLPAAEDSATKESKTGSDDSSKRRKMAAGAISHYGETHKRAEKRRRCKINQSLKTLQHLVPGCDNSSHASTLEQTIQYMKTLQQQIWALAANPSRPVPATAMHPVVQPQYVPPGPPVTLAPMVVLGSPPMVPLGPVLPLPHYPAPAVMMPAAATSLYPGTAAPRFASPAGSLGQGSSRGMRGKK